MSQVKDQILVKAAEELGGLVKVAVEQVRYHLARDFHHIQNEVVLPRSLCGQVNELGEEHGQTRETLKEHSSIHAATSVVISQLASSLDGKIVAGVSSAIREFLDSEVLARQVQLLLVRERVLPLAVAGGDAGRAAS
eukprot:2468262-Pyramimonas_sp.AAC.1